MGSTGYDILVTKPFLRKYPTGYG